jgi:F-type H+-transporting ATPase subunit delta
LGQQPAGGSIYVADDESIVAGMAGRYATALFDLAKEQGALDAVAGDLAAISTMLGQSPDLARLVRSPVFSAEDQARAMSAVLDKAGVSGLTQNFIKLIARNRRLFSLSDMIRDFQTLFARMKGQITAEVTSAQPLTDAQRTQLLDSLKASLNKDVQLRTTVDPTILGGLIVKAGSRMIDSSIKTKLNNLKFAMKEVR